MKINNFIELEQLLNEAGKKEPIRGKKFEKVVLAELLVKSSISGRALVLNITPQGIINKKNPTKMIIIGKGNKIRSFELPALSALKTPEGVYDIAHKYVSPGPFPDFKMTINRFLGYDGAIPLWIEAKSTKADVIALGERGNIHKALKLTSGPLYEYFQWWYKPGLASSKPPLKNRSDIVKQANRRKKGFLGALGLTSSLKGGGELLARVAIAKPSVGQFGKIKYFKFDHTVEYSKYGHFEMSPRGILIFKFKGKEFFRINKATSSRDREAKRERVKTTMSIKKAIKGGIVEPYEEQTILEDVGLRTIRFVASMDIYSDSGYKNRGVGRLLWRQGATRRMPVQIISIVGSRFMESSNLKDRIIENVKI